MPARRYFVITLLLSVSCCLHSNAASLTDTLFTENRISLHSETGDLIGTLTLPTAGGKFPIVVIIAGSGPTDRNGNGPGFQTNSYLQLAYALAGEHIASLRFDKRGVAESAAATANEADLRFDTYVTDAQRWIQLIKKDTRFTSVFVIGHSEGSLIGMLASHASVSGYVSIAGAGRPIDKVLKEQLLRQPKDIQDVSYAIIDSLRLGRTVARVDPRVQTLFRPSVQPYLISWFKYDPASEIARLNTHVLIIQGTADLQVPVSDAQMLKNADSSATLMLIPHMNHVLKIVADDTQSNIAAYNDPSLPISDQLVKEVARFVRSYASPH